MFLTACESLYYNQFDVMHSNCCEFSIYYMQSTLRPTNWVTLERTIINSTGPHKLMNIIRDSLLAKITLGYFKWLLAYGRNYYVHQHPSTYVFAKIIHRENLLRTQLSRYISLQGNNQAMMDK